MYCTYNTVDSQWNYEKLERIERKMEAIFGMFRRLWLFTESSTLINPLHRGRPAERL